MLDKPVLEHFMQDFFGYGDLTAPLWFIGMEEGGGNTIESLQMRLAAWREGGGKTLEDMAHYHRKIGSGELFDAAKPRFQITWAKLCRSYLEVRQRPCDTESTRMFQRNVLGREASGTCLMELMPLPPPGLSTWSYDVWSDIDYLRSRNLYMSEVLPKRVRSLKRLISENKPRCVVFFGVGYRAFWERIVDGLQPTDWKEFPSVPVASKTTIKDVTFVLMPHPVAHGSTNKQWLDLGAGLRDVL